MKKILFILLGLMAVFYVRAQSITPSTCNSAGGSNTIGGNLYEWSFGEMLVINTSIGSNVIVTAGLLQPSDPNVGIAELPLITGRVNVYPSPTSDLLNIETAFQTAGKFSYRFTDLDGKILGIDEFSLSTGSNTRSLSVSRFPAGEYLLTIIYSPEKTSGKFVQTFKVQKIN